MKSSRSVIGVPSSLLSFLFLALVSSAAQTIQIHVSTFRPQRGQVVNLSVDVSSIAEYARRSFKAEILVPSMGAKPLPVEALANGKYKASFTVAGDAPQGLYSVHAWTGENSASFEVGNATFFVGKIIADFFEPAVLNQSNPARDMDGYLQDFGRMGGNLIIAHSIITLDRAYFPCTICKNSAAPGSPDNRIEILLQRTDSSGVGVLMSVSWDMTYQAPYTERWAQIQSIMKDLNRLYRLSIPADSFRMVEWRAGARSLTGARSHLSRQTQNGVIP